MNEPLSAGAIRTAQALLDWDLKRAAAIALRGHDVTVYQLRQRAAQGLVAAGLPPREWPIEVRHLFMALLEVSMVPQQVMQYGVGATTSEGHADRAALRVLAAELGVIEKLREVAPRHWGEGAR
jgi:hypothetical protein